MAATTAAEFQPERFRKGDDPRRRATVEKTLAANGYRVVIPRDSDVFRSLGTRVAIANSYANAIFVSIHSTRPSAAGAGGIETYFLQTGDLPLARLSITLSRGRLPSNRNVRRRGYYVLRKATVPAVLGGMRLPTNPNEAA